MMKQKLLIANRGEIACRIIKTAKKMKIPTVAIYSEIDGNSKHVKLADESYCVGQNLSSQSYLRMEKIIEVAKQSNTTLIHPGFGFLSENKEFSKSCRDNGISFVGPSEYAINLMGSKQASKITMQKANVPVVPGYEGDEQDPQHLQKQADKIGYPVLIKATLGGGGKGMRIVNTSHEFQEQLESAKNEAIKHFKDDRVILEKYIERSRHIEVQVLGDHFGNYVYLFERDCSIQRRHQKAIEEAPSNIGESLRKEICESAINAAKAVKYYNAGTVEFIFDVDTNKYYFMEMNTRLQVEHPITEMITNKDLVELQLNVAMNNKLPFGQDQLQINGHSFEARIYSEDPYNGFLPQIGKLKYMKEPQQLQNYLRIDSGIREKDEINTFYDPMISKLIVWDVDRNKALNRLNDALQNYKIIGNNTNIRFLKNVINKQEFIDYQYDTDFIKKHQEELLKQEKEVNPNEILKAAISKVVSQLQSTQNRSDLNILRINSNRCQDLKFEVTAPFLQENVRVNAKVTHVQQNNGSISYKIQIGEQIEFINIISYSENKIEISSQDKSESIEYYSENNVVYIFNCNGDTLRFDCLNEVVPQKKESNINMANSIISPMPGTIQKVLFKVGDKVTNGQTIIVIEAMKMEHNIKALKDAVIKAIKCEKGKFIEQGSLIIEYE